MSGKRAFLDLLKQEGVEIMFGNPGTTELPLMDAFATENELRYLLGLQEAAVMAMADGYAQASGKLAVVNLHVAPGLGNAMGARVIAVDLSPERLQLAKQFGADVTLNPKDGDVVAAVKDLTHGEGAETALDCTGQGICREARRS